MERIGNDEPSHDVLQVCSKMLCEAKSAFPFEAMVNEWHEQSGVSLAQKTYRNIITMLCNAADTMRKEPDTLVDQFLGLKQVVRDALNVPRKDDVVHAAATIFELMTSAAPPMA